ncbi:hypothetical protein PI125_g7744 [Phytophthora idaei]|nr:hypothetical protein PI125_g7744 [Phytophthora idaei]
MKMLKSSGTLTMVPSLLRTTLLMKTSRIRKKRVWMMMGAADEDSQSDPNSPGAIAERHFTKKFLTSLGGVDKVLASAKDMDKLREHSTTGWSDLVYPDLFEYIQTPLAKRIATLGYEKSRMDLRQKQSSVEIHP